MHLPRRDQRPGRAVIWVVLALVVVHLVVVLAAMSVSIASAIRRSANRPPRVIGQGSHFRRRRSEVENDDFARFAVRMIRAHGRRIALGDVEGPADPLALADELATTTQVAVDGLRARGYAWSEIASRLITTRQAAQQRWG